jgi:hypothetical protein
MKAKAKTIQTKARPCGRSESARSVYGFKANKAANFVAPQWTCVLTESNMQKENKQGEQPGDPELA